MDYKSALRAYYPAPAHITYAGKAFLCKAIAEWTQDTISLWIALVKAKSRSQLQANVKREHILVHGVNKSIADLKVRTGICRDDCRR